MTLNLTKLLQKQEESKVHYSQTLKDIKATSSYKQDAKRAAEVLSVLKQARHITCE